MTTNFDPISHFQFGDKYEFKYRVISSDFSQERQKEEINTLTNNAMFFQLEGRLKIIYDNQNEVVVNPGEFYFLPRGANVSACIDGDRIIYITARLDHNIDNRSIFNMLLKTEEQDLTIDYSFVALPFKKPLAIFIESIKHYLIDGVDSQQLHSMKFLELYFIFRNYYTKQECINMFHPILKENSKFKTFILDNYCVSTSIDNLAAKANMSRSTFDRTFKENFGITPYKWIEIQTRIIIMRKAAEPNVTIKDIMYEVGVYNPSQFTQLCKRLCGVAPSQLIRV